MLINRSLLLIIDKCVFDRSGQCLIHRLFSCLLCGTEGWGLKMAPHNCWLGRLRNFSLLCWRVGIGGGDRVQTKCYQILTEVISNKNIDKDNDDNNGNGNNNYNSLYFQRVTHLVVHSNLP